MEQSNEIRLRFSRVRPFTLTTNKTYFSEERLRVDLRIPCDSIPTYTFQSAIIDTGALFSIFPHSVWKLFEQPIEFFDVTDLSSTVASFKAKPLFHVRAVGAKGSPCRLGLVPVSFTDGKVISPEVTILAQFVEQAGSWNRLVLGLGGGAIGSHALMINHTPGQATLSVIESLD